MNQSSFQNEKESNRWKPVQRGIAISTNSIIRLSEKLFTLGADVVYTHVFSQDFLESYFSVLRRYAGPRATSHRVILTQRTLQLSNLFTGKRAVQIPQESLSFKFNRKPILCTNYHFEKFLPDYLDVSDSELQAIYYIAGSITKRILNSGYSFCVICKRLL